jgi:phosphoglycerol transferase MdoB-like AlkP superfamily enzyme
MKCDNDSNRFEDTARDALEYCRLQVEAVKLRVLETVATLFNNIFVVLVLVVTLSIALLFLAVALTLILAQATGSLLCAVLIISAIFLIASIVVYYLRKDLIVNPAVKMLSKLMFGNKNGED